MKKTAVHPDALSADKFREFARHFPDYYLKERNIKGTTFYAVAMAIAEFCTYETGTNVFATQKAISDTARCDHRSVKRVIELLKETGALEVTGKKFRAGTPSESFEFRKSPVVVRVLEEKNRRWKPEQAKTGVQPPKTGVQPPKTGVQPLKTGVAPDNNIETFNDLNNRSDESSLSPIGASPLGSASASRSEEVDSILNGSMSKLDLILVDL